ncbi:hypothetical protein HYT52_03930 [Candidatus Woesearchaeota archaeon]|nr:hypothetical protein [Candidatus Woesearchaeota archaeon]
MEERLHYDPWLMARLTPGHATMDGLVINPEFKKWEEHIRETIRDRQRSYGGRYERSSDQRLLRGCQEHVERYSSPLTADTAVLLVHPFYLHLSHMGKLRSRRVRSDANNYLNRLFHLLSHRPSREKAGIVVMETLHHYTSVTSLLLEQKLVDGVVFTLHDDGLPLNREDFLPFLNKRLFFGGGYNGSCFTNSLGYAINEVHDEDDIYVISNLVLNSPLHHVDRLHPRQIIEGGSMVEPKQDMIFPQNKMVTLDRALEMMENGESRE